MSFMGSRNSRLLTTAIALSGIVGACSSDRATIFDPVGGPSFNARFAVVGTNLPRGNVERRNKTGTANDTMIVRLAGLEALETGVYQVWLADTSGTTVSNYVKATGNLRIITTDTVFVQGDPVGQPDTVIVPGVSSFAQGGPATRFELIVTQATLGSPPLAKTLLLVTIEDNDAATQPNADVRPLWLRLAADAAGNTNPALNFGNFTEDPAAQYIFVPSGRGTIGFRENVIVVDDSALSRPPKGYYYATHFVRIAVDTTPVNPAPDIVTIDTIILGAQTAPYPRRNVSLRNADMTLVDPVVIPSPPSILAAANRFNGAGGAQPFRNFTTGFVTLETKKGFESVASPAVVLSAAVPEIVRLGQVPAR